VQSDGLIDGAQLVEAIRPQRTNAQTQIDFREGWNCCIHEVTLYLHGLIDGATAAMIRQVLQLQAPSNGNSSPLNSPPVGLHTPVQLQGFQGSACPYKIRPLMRKAALFYNPHSGRRKKHRLKDVEAAASILRAAGIEVEVAPTRAASDAAAQVRMSIREGFDAIVACGGDGTVHDVLQGLAGKDAVLGIIPLGTANALAHDLRLPISAEGAARALLTATPKRIGVGKIEYRNFNNIPSSRFFTVAAGVGVDAHLFYKLNRLIKDRMGMLAYYTKATHLWLTHRMRYFEAEFSENGGGRQREARLSEMLAVRINHFGGVLRELAPGASLARNDMRLVLCRTGNRALYLAYVFRGMLGLSNGVPGIELVHADEIICRHAEGEKNEDIYVEADGELLGRLPITLSMVPDALTVLVPQNHPMY
jgi:diacylglycerol kinase (ATP)